MGAGLRKRLSVVLTARPRFPDSCALDVRTVHVAGGGPASRSCRGQPPGHEWCRWPLGRLEGGRRYSKAAVGSGRRRSGRPVPCCRRNSRSPPPSIPSWEPAGRIRQRTVVGGSLRRRLPHCPGVARRAGPDPGGGRPRATPSGIRLAAKGWQTICAGRPEPLNRRPRGSRDHRPRRSRRRGRAAAVRPGQ